MTSLNNEEHELENLLAEMNVNIAVITETRTKIFYFTIFLRHGTACVYGCSKAGYIGC